jgi:hypothetical protein
VLTGRVPAGELERLGETIEDLSDRELVHDLREGLAEGPRSAGRILKAAGQRGRGGQRSDLANFLTSPTKSSGCSRAAKWPP